MIKGLKKIAQGLSSVNRAAARIHSLLETGEIDEANDTVLPVVEKYPNSVELHLLNAQIAILKQDHERAKRSLLTIESLNTNFQQHYRAAQLLQNVGDDQAALRYLYHVGRTFPGWESGVGYATAMHVHRRLGQNEKALRAAVDACSVGGRIAYSSLIDLIENSTDKVINDCHRHMHEKLAVSDRNAYFFKMLSILDNRLGHDEDMVKHIRRAARKRLRRNNPEVEWAESMHALKPSFLIIGAMKCGTTSLFGQLAKHPKCLEPIDKELQFFQYPQLSDRWYLEHFPHVSEFPGFITGEGSPGYYAFDIVDRVKHVLPDVKLIFIKRDPAERAISHLRHNNKVGLSGEGLDAVLWRIDELEEELTSAPERASQTLVDICTGKREHNNYLAMGCYDFLMQRWRDKFPETQLLELELEKFQSDPNVMNQVFEYVGLEPIELQAAQQNAGHYSKKDEQTLQITARLEKFYSSVELAFQKTRI